MAKLNDSGTFPFVDAKLTSALSVILSPETRGGANNEGSIRDLCDLIQVRLHNGQLVTILSDWAYVHGATQMLPPDNILGSLFYHHVHCT